MDVSPSAHSPDVRESRPSFRKPANEASRRNYRRHSPSSSRSRTPSPGGWKRERSPLVSQEDGGSKKGRTLDPDSEKGREDGRFKRGTDAGSRSYGNHSRDRHGRAEDYDYNYNRRHSSYHDRSYHNSVHARTDYSRYDDGRYARRSPERSIRERTTDENGYRRRENRLSERDRDRDDRFINARSAERDRIREDESDVRDRYKSRDREPRHGQERFGGKERDDGSDVEADRSRHGRRIDNRRDAVDVEGRDRDTDKVDSRERHKIKPDTEKLKEKESRRRETDDGKESENDKVDGDRRKSRDKGHKGHDEHRRKTNSMTDLRKDYSSSEPENTGEHLRERSHGQDSSKRGGRDKKHSSENVKSKFSNVEPARGADATSDHSNELKRLDDKYSKGSKWGPEAENADATAASSDPEVAKMAAMKAAALVNINLGGIKSVDEKKKMLWGSKDQQKPVAVTGTNRWETVRFADRDRQDKFQKLMSLSVLSYLYPNVGCQRRCGGRWPRKCRQSVHNRKARRTTTGFGKAIYCGSAKARWSDCWIGSLVCNYFFWRVLRKAFRSPGLLTKQDFCYGCFVLHMLHRQCLM